TGSRFVSTAIVPRVCLYNRRVAEPAPKTPALPDDSPSLDPLAIERNYQRERARRRARVERRSAAKRSDVRFWVTLLALAFLPASIIPAACHGGQTLLGVGGKGGNHVPPVGPLLPAATSPAEDWPPARQSRAPAANPPLTLTAGDRASQGRQRARPRLR